MISYNLLMAQENSLNQIIIDDLTEKRSETDYVLYIPAYLGMKLKSIDELKFQGFNAKVNQTCQLTIKLGNLPDKLKKLIIQNMILQIRRNDALKIGTKQDLQIEMTNKTKGYYSFIIRKSLNVRLEPYLFFTPFQVVDMVTSFHLKSQIHTIQNDDQDNEKKLYVTFNLMDKFIDPDQKLSRIEDLISFTQNCAIANYDLAEKRVHAQFTNNPNPKSLIALKKNIYNCKVFSNEMPEFSHQIKTKNIQQGYNSLPRMTFAHFHIPVYRFPASIFVTVFIPLWILGVLNLSVFYEQEKTLSVKIDNIATVLLAYFTLITVIQDAIPEQPYITMMEIITFLQILTPFLAVLQGLSQRNQTEPISNFYIEATYMISLIITLIVILLPIFGYCIYQFYLFPRHNKSIKIKYKQGNEWDNNFLWYQKQSYRQKYLEYKKKNKLIYEKDDQQQYDSVIKQLQRLEFVKED